MLKTLGSVGAPVTLGKFVECMADAANHVTLQSILKLECSFKECDRQFDVHLKRLSNNIDSWEEELLSNSSEAGKYGDAAEATSAQKGNGFDQVVTDVLK